MKTIALRKIAQYMGMVAVFVGFAQAAAACVGGGTAAQEELGRLLLKTNYSSISCKYLGTPYSFDGLQAHAGIDYLAAAGTTVYAPMSGNLLKSSTFVYGNAVYYDLGNGKKLFIHHLRDYKTGWVNKGDPIAKIYRDHVHAELRVEYYRFSLLGKDSCDKVKCTHSQVDQKTDDPSSVVVVGTPLPTLKSVYVTCPSSINENSSGVCTAVASYSDKSSKSVIPTWSSNNASLSVSSDGRISAGSVSRDITGVGVTGVYSEGGKTVQGTAPITIKDVPAPLPTLSSLYVTCPSSINENSSGVCTANVYYSNGGSKAVTPSWKVGGSGLSISSNGNIATGSVSSNTNASVTGIYSEDGKTVQGTAPITIIKDIPKLDVWTGKNSNGTVCDKDAQTVSSRIGTYGTVELRWSDTCKTKWARVASNSSSYSVTAKVGYSNNSDFIYTSSGEGYIYTNMVSGFDVKTNTNIRTCANGTVNGETLSRACY